MMSLCEDTSERELIHAEEDRHHNIEKRMPGEDRGSAWRVHLQAKGKQERKPPLEPSVRTGPHQHLDFRLPASRAMKE